MGKGHEVHSIFPDLDTNAVIPNADSVDVVKPLHLLHIREV